MRKLLLTIVLSAGTLTAQTIQPGQIKPATTNGFVLTTVGGQTVWAPGGGSSGTCGPLAGDATSTDCGNGNFAGGSDGTTSQAFGFQNIINSDANNSVAVGANNLTNVAGHDGGTTNSLIGIGNGSTSNITNTSGLTDNLIGIGFQSLVNADGSDLIAMGEQSGAGILSTATTPGCFSQEIIAIGDGTAGGSSLPMTDIIAIGNGAGSGYGTNHANTCDVPHQPQDVIAIGDGAGVAGEAFSGGPTYMPQAYIAIGEGAGIWFGGQNSIAVGLGAGGNYLAGSSDIITLGTSAGSGPTNANTTPPGHTFPIVAIHDLIAIGQASGLSNSGNEVIAIGDHALTQVTPQSGTTAAVGNSGTDNIAIGDFALTANTSGHDNIGIGKLAGSLAGFLNQTGSNNTWIGDNSGPNTTTQLSNTVAVGFGARVSASNQTAIGSSATTSLLLFGCPTGQSVLDDGSGTCYVPGSSSFITSLTTTGTSGPATVTGGVLNIPQYTGGGGPITLASVGPGASPSGLFDFSGATNLKVPIVAGYTAPTAGSIGYDSTNGNLHTNYVGTDLIIAGIPSASLPTSGNCAKFNKIGQWWEIIDAGAPCGSGGGSSSFSAITAGTNPNALAVSGTLVPTGIGVIQANNIANTLICASGCTLGGAGTVANPYALTVTVAGTGTVTDGSGTTTAGVIAESTTTAHVLDYNSLLDNGHTTANTLTYSGSGGIASIGSTHGITIPAGTAVAGAAGKVIYASDATSGFAEVNENNTGLSRICTVANALCTGSVGVTQIVGPSSTVTGSVSFTGAGVSQSGNTFTFSGSGAVSSVSNSDGSLTISPTTGAVVASLALGHTNTWTAKQSFTLSAVPVVLTNTSSTSSVQILDGLCPNLTSGQNCFYNVGQSDATGDEAGFNFKYVGNNNAGNAAFISFFGNPAIQQWFNSGNTEIGNTTPTDPGVILGVGTTNQFKVTSAGDVSTSGTATFHSIATGTASNSDLAGTLTLSSGTASFTFSATNTHAPFCVATDNTATNAVKTATTATTLTVTGTGTDVVTYICVRTN